MANGNPISPQLAPQFAFSQQMEQRGRNREMFPLRKEEVRSQNERRRALTDLTEFKTERGQKMLPGELEAQQKKLAGMQLEQDIARSDMNYQKLNRKYSLQAAAGHNIMRNLEQGNTKEANAVAQKFAEDYRDTFGEEHPLASRIEKGGLSPEDLPRVTAMTDMGVRNLEQIQKAMQTERQFGYDKRLIEERGTEERKSIRTRGDESRKTLDAEYDLRQDLAEAEADMGTARDPLSPPDLNKVRQNVIYDVINAEGMADHSLTPDAQGNVKETGQAAGEAEYATNQITTITDYMHRKGVPDPQGRAAEWWKRNFQYKNIKEDTMETSIWTNEPETSAWVPRDRQERKDLFERIKKTMDNYPDMSQQEKKEMMEHNLRLYHNFKIKRSLASEVNY